MLFAYVFYYFYYFFLSLVNIKYSSLRCRLKFFEVAIAQSAIQFVVSCLCASFVMSTSFSNYFILQHFIFISFRSFLFFLLHFYDFLKVFARILILWQYWRKLSKWEQEWGNTMRMQLKKALLKFLLLGSRNTKAILFEKIIKENILVGFLPFYTVSLDCNCYCCLRKQI